MVFKTIGLEYPLVLASNSPRRKELLRAVGIPFVVYPSNVNEYLTGSSPIEYSRHLAREKAKSSYLIKEGHWVLGADTVVVLEDQILGKPTDPEDAFRILKLLSGKTHEVITSFTILDPSGDLAHEESVLTLVSFKELSAQEIEAYIATGEPMDKAGAYGIQGIGAFMVKRIAGSYSNVVGLPLFELISALLKVGSIRAFPLPSSASISRTG